MPITNISMDVLILFDSHHRLNYQQYTQDTLLTTDIQLLHNRTY